MLPRPIAPYRRLVRPSPTRSVHFGLTQLVSHQFQGHRNACRHPGVAARRPRPRTPMQWEIWPGKAYPARRHLRRLRHQLRAVQRGRRARRAVPVRRRRHRDPAHAARGRRLRLARLPARRRARPALRLPRARTVRPRSRTALQPEQAAARPVRQGDRRHLRVGPVAVRLRLRRPGQPQRRRLGGQHAEVGGDQPVLRLGHRPAAAARVRRLDHLRGARQGPDRDAPRHPGAQPRHLRRDRAPGDHRAPQGARHHRDRADAGAPLRQRLDPDRQGPVELLGLQHHRLLRAGLQVRQPAPPPAARCRSSRRWCAPCTRRTSR